MKKVAKDFGYVGAVEMLDKYMSVESLRKRMFPTTIAEVISKLFRYTLTRKALEI